MSNKETVSYAVLNWDNEEASKTTIELNVASETAKYVIHRALVAQRSQQRHVIASTKIRSEVRGGGRKPWKQKGTGRARAGSNRSPLWRGGGVIFGPRNAINYTRKINQKENKLAIRTLLLNKSNVTKIVESFEDKFALGPNTKSLLEALKRWDLSVDKRVLVICKNKTKNLYLSTRNLKNIDLISCRSLNTIDLLNAQSIIITSDSMPIIEKLYNEE
nr:ribosomal protein L4 [Erythrotrichia welwitschii]